MSDPIAYSLSRFYRVVGTDGRISGTWVVMLPVQSDKKTIVFPHEVTFYDAGRRSGRVAYSKDFTAWVAADGAVELPHHMIRSEIRDDVLDAEAALIALLPDIAAAALGGEA